MTQAKLRIGVAGLGRIGWCFHCHRLAEHPDFSLVAVSDLDADRLVEARETFPCATYEDTFEMIDQAGLDAMVIATPTHLHEAMALKAFESGLHVLLEKPMAPTFAEAERIVTAAETFGRVLTVYQPHRVNAYFQHLKALIDSGRIGRVYWVQRGSFNYARRNDWQSLMKYGGGMLSNYGAHYLDQILQLIGYDIKRIFCNLQLVASLGDADDVVKIVLETRDGVLGDCTINQASTSKPFEFLIWGSCGTIEYTGKAYHLRYFDPSALPEKELDPSLGSEGRRYPSDAIEMIEETIPVDSSFQVDVFADFASAIREGTALVVPPRETLALMSILEECRSSSAGIRKMV